MQGDQNPDARGAFQQKASLHGTDASDVQPVCFKFPFHECFLLGSETVQIFCRLQIDPTLKELHETSLLILFRLSNQQNLLQHDFIQN
jgi:hypothetical protein